MMSSESDSRVVWNSDEGNVGGRSFDMPKKRAKKSRRAAPDAGFPQDGVARVRRETGGRRGKTVTVLYGVPGSEDDRRRLLKELKQLCGCGGAYKEGRIEIQGDQRDKIMTVLREKGIEAKAAGG
jgi:translation initiation factor 1